MKRFAFYLVFIPLAAVILLFALANRQPVIVSFNLFGSDVSGQRMPLFLVIFLMLMLGIVIGGAASWLSQSKIRKDARHAKAEVERYRLELDQLRMSSSPSEPAQLPPPGPF